MIARGARMMPRYVGQGGPPAPAAQSTRAGVRERPCIGVNPRRDRTGLPSPKSAPLSIVTPGAASPTCAQSRLISSTHHQRIILYLAHHTTICSCCFMQPANSRLSWLPISVRRIFIPLLQPKCSRIGISRTPDIKHQTLHRQSRRANTLAWSSSGSTFLVRLIKSPAYLLSASALLAILMLFCQLPSPMG